MPQKHLISIVFGTRPEIIKLWPLIEAINRSELLEAKLIFTGQQKDLGPEFLSLFDLSVTHYLETLVKGQSLSSLVSKLVCSIEKVLLEKMPSMIVVQGDTSSAMSGALVARQLRIPVAHVEAGLRTGNIDSPFPEESNRRVITHLASLHFAATISNRKNLLAEGIPSQDIVVTGNTVVDALQKIIPTLKPDIEILELLGSLINKRIVVLTMHRRENSGDRNQGYSSSIRNFLDHNLDVSMVAIRHPNPLLSSLYDDLAAHPNCSVIDPLGYGDFIYLLQQAWLILSDSGGIQEEVATLKKPLIILREHTERPEAIESGNAKLAQDGESLSTILNLAVGKPSWLDDTRSAHNPFGDGQASERIVSSLETFLAGSTSIVSGKNL